MINERFFLGIAFFSAVIKADLTPESFLVGVGLLVLLEVDLLVESTGAARKLAHKRFLIVVHS